MNEKHQTAPGFLPSATEPAKDQPTMTRALKPTSHVDYAELALLAFAAWQKDGAPPGRELLYWAEAENQLKSTHHRLLAEARHPTPPHPATGVPPDDLRPILRAA